MPKTAHGGVGPPVAGTPSLMTSSRSARPRGMWNSPHGSLRREYPPRRCAGSCDVALKATPVEAPLVHRRLLDTQ